MQSFMPIHFFVFKIQTIKNGLAGPKSFWGFRETGPRTSKNLLRQEKMENRWSLGYSVRRGVEKINKKKHKTGSPLLVDSQQKKGKLFMSVSILPVTQKLTIKPCNKYIACLNTNQYSDLQLSGLSCQVMPVG